MILVSNTGPLVALAKIDALTLLKNLFGTVHIAPAVHQELLAKAGPEAQRLDTALADFLTVTPPPSLPEQVDHIITTLGPGEQQAIALADGLEALRRFTPS